MTGQVCPLHSDEWISGTRTSDGGEAFTCPLSKGHPGNTPWSWLAAPEPPAGAGLSGLAEELNLAIELPEALERLGPGWFEYGLVERSYALKHPEDFQRMVAQWGHTAIKMTKYSASAYLAHTLGRLGRQGYIAYHQGPGTGRWSYNSDISYWSILPVQGWAQRTAWVDEFGDHSREDQLLDVHCRAYVLRR